MRLRGATLALTLAAGAALSTADERAYRKGIEALDRGRWSEVARFMAEAIKDDPNEGGEVKLYGMRYETYLPHFYLGLALSKLGNCEDAIEPLRTSEKQGAVKASARFAELVDTLKACEARVSRPGPSPPAPKPASPTPDPALLARTLRAAEQGLARAEEASRSIAALEHDPVLLSAVEAYFAGKYDETLRRLEIPSGASGRITALVCLFRAAASYALYQSGDPKDGALLDQAIKDVRACRRSDPSLTPDLEAFSPRFVAFFRSNR